MVGRHDGVLRHRGPADREEIIKGYEAQAAKVNNQYDLGLLTEEERRQELINLWTECTDKVAEAMRENFHDDNNVNIMVQSGARGNWMQIRQIAGMRGLVANPKGEIIPRPVKSNYREGLSVLEYFISQHGARKGLADTALRTAESATSPVVSWTSPRRSSCAKRTAAPRTVCP